MILEFVQQNVLWVSVAVVSGGMLLWPLIIGGAGATAMSPAEATLAMNRQDAVVLDIRETSEFAKGHIGGARHITQAQLSTRLSEIEKFKARPIIVCCATGQRSASACADLKKAGFEQAYNLAGGLDAWSAAGLPLTTKA